MTLADLARSADRELDLVEALADAEMADLRDLFDSLVAEAPTRVTRTALHHLLREVMGRQQDHAEWMEART